jgi:hypothetical protein
MAGTTGLEPAAFAVTAFNDIEEHRRHCKSLEVHHSQRYCVSRCVSRIFFLLFEFRSGSLAAPLGGGAAVRLAALAGLVVRYEFHAENFLGMVRLGCMKIVLRYL